MKKFIAALLIISVSIPSAHGATAKPTAKPTSKASAKPTSKATSSAKPVVKKPVAKKPVVKKRRAYVPKKIKLTPAPKPVWPPKGFVENNGVFARVPTGTELVGLLSAKSTLGKTLAACEASACGAVYVASASDCTWWEISATVFGPSYADITTYLPYGTLRTLVGGSAAHTVTPVFLLTTEPLIPNEDLILQTLGLKRDKFYGQISLGQSLRQIAGAKINSVVSAITAAEKKDIDARLASGLITATAAADQRDQLPARVSSELTAYNLTVGAINVKCWISSPTEVVPSNVYTPITTR